MKLRIRQTDDLDTVIDLDRVVFPLDAKVQGPHLLDAQWWVAEALEAEWVPVGYGGVYIDPTTTEAVLVRAGVLPEYRGFGIQKRLIRVREAYARRCLATWATTYTTTANIRSQRSLVAMGYSPIRYEKTDDNAFLHFMKRLTK